MPLHALLYRRTSEPRTIDVAVDGIIHAVLLRRHRQAKTWLDAHGADLHRYGLPDAS